MLDRLIDSLKLAAWFAVASACLIATILAHRAPQSLLGRQAVENQRQILKCSYSEPALQPVPLTMDVASCSDCGCVDGSCHIAPTLTASPIAVQATDDGEFQPTAALVVALPLQPACSDAADDEPAKGTKAKELPNIVVDTDSCGPSASKATCPCPELVPLVEIPDPPVHEELLVQTPFPPIERAAEESHNADQAKPTKTATVTTCPTQSITQRSGTLSCSPHCEAATTTETSVTMRDIKTNHAVATLRMGSRIAATPIGDEELQEAAAERRRQRLQMRRKKSVPTGQVAVYQDDETGNIVIDADTVEISDLAEKLSGQFHRAVVCHESAYGTVSARVSDVTFLRTLRRLVEPFGLAVLDLGDQLVIGEVVALENAERRVALMREQEAMVQAQMAAVAEKQNTEDAPTADPLPTNEATQPDDPTETVQATHTVPSKAAPHEIEIGKVARALIAGGNLNATKELLENSIEDHPDSAIFLRMLGEVHWHQQQFAPAREAIKASLELDKHNPLTNQLYGEILQHFGQSTRANHYFQQAQHLRSLQ